MVPPPLTLTLKDFYNTEASKGAGAPWWFDLGVVKSGPGYTEMMAFNTVATAALNELLDTSRRKRLTSDAILREVADFYGVDLRSMQGRGRSRNIVVPRQVAMYLLREETDSSLMDIGQMLGGRDHTTVLHACRLVRELIATDGRVREDWDKLLRSLTG